jgi:catechol 2,3-dioxygenase-like lactoylglutathione lyase family enzyme
MSDDVANWSIRSIIVSVSDLDRSANFYGTLMNMREVIREDQVTVLDGGSIGAFTLYLRQAHRNPVHVGQQALGVRALTCDVGDFAELDRVEERLKSLDAFWDRPNLKQAKAPDLAIVRGHDPDRLPLTFVGHPPGRELSEGDYHRWLAMIYAMDL